MKDKILRTFNGAKLQVIKHGPEIFMAAGIAGAIVSTVIACKKTLKVKEIIDEKNENMKMIKEGLDDESLTEYTEKDAQRDTVITYTQMGVKLFKLYSPAIGLGVLSIASILVGQKILKKRNLALAAAYTIVNNSFNDYRKNVIDEMGAGFDQRMRFGLKTKEIKVKDPETGEKTKETVIEKVENPIDEYSTYARYFDASCDNFTKDPEYNLLFLRKQQDYANDKLKAQGYLFLNEVYDMLDIPRTKAGQIVGWIYDPENNKNGDNYVDFGIYKDGKINNNRRFVNGLEYNVLLDFNVDGPIYNILDDAYLMAKHRNV